jgi:hypothetical protein
MPNFLQRYATPLVTGLFLVSLVSGIALFFHWEQGWFKGMHEWLSMVLILPFVLHIWKNWRAMTVYFVKPAFAISMVLSLVAALAFVFPGAGEGGPGGPPPLALSHQILQNPPATVAPLVGKTAEALAAQLTAAGYTIDTPQQTLAEIARIAGKSEFEIEELLIEPAP